MRQVRTDARLLAPALAVWAAAAWASTLPAHVAERLGLATLLVGAIGLRAAGRRSGGLLGDGWRLPATLCLLCAGGGLLSVAVRQQAVTSGPLPALARQQAGATITGVATGDAFPIRSTGRGAQFWLLDVRATRVRSGSRAWTLSRPVLVLASGSGWGDILPSTRLSLPGVLDSPRPGDTVSAVLHVRGSPLVLAGPSTVQRMAGALRAGLRQAAASLPARERGLLPGLVDGDTSALPATVTQQFRVDGLTHLVAVSGSNVAAVLVAAVAVARRLRARRSAPVWAAVALVAFVALARPSPSVLRAAVMGVIAMAGVALGRERPALPALCATVLGLILVDPALAVSAGFALSTLASGALLVLAPGWQAGLERRGVRPAVAAAVTVPLAAQVVCGPVIAVFTGTVSIVAVLANLVAVPAVPWATVAGVTSAVVAPLSPALAAVAAWVAFPACWWLVTVAAVASRSPAAQLPWPGGVTGGLLLGVSSMLLLWAARAAVRALLPVRPDSLAAP